MPVHDGLLRNFPYVAIGKSSLDSCHEVSEPGDTDSSRAQEGRSPSVSMGRAETAGATGRATSTVPSRPTRRVSVLHLEVWARGAEARHHRGARVLSGDGGVVSGVGGEGGSDSLACDDPEDRRRPSRCHGPGRDSGASDGYCFNSNVRHSLPRVAWALVARARCCGDRISRVRNALGASRSIIRKIRWRATLYGARPAGIGSPGGAWEARLATA